MTAVLYILITTHLTGVILSIYYHRSLSHHSVSYHPLIEHCFRLYLWLTTGIDRVVYVGVHRIHHANSDTELDPTSPNHADKKLYSKVIWQFSDKLPDVTYEKLKKYAPDIQAESLYTNGKLGLATLLFIDVILFNILGIAIWLAQLLWVVFYSAVTLGVCHSGKQQPNTTDRSQNIMPLAIMFGGEELHNNHHKHIASAKFSDKWYEFDIGYFYIRILSALRLATIRLAITQHK